MLNLDEAITEAKAKAEASRQEMMRVAEILSQSRLAILNAIENELKRLLSEVGMPNASVKINHTPIKPANSGADE